MLSLLTVPLGLHIAITGSSQGIGNAAAKQLLADHDKTFLSGRNRHKL